MAIKGVRTEDRLWGVGRIEKKIWWKVKRDEDGRKYVRRVEIGYLSVRFWKENGRKGSSDWLNYACSISLTWMKVTFNVWFFFYNIHISKTTLALKTNVRTGLIQNKKCKYKKIHNNVKSFNWNVWF